MSNSVTLWTGMNCVQTHSRCAWTQAWEFHVKLSQVLGLSILGLKGIRDTSNQFMIITIWAFHPWKSSNVHFLNTGQCFLVTEQDPICSEKEERKEKLAITVNILSFPSYFSIFRIEWHVTVMKQTSQLVFGSAPLTPLDMYILPHI